MIFFNEEANIAEDNGTPPPHFVASDGWCTRFMKRDALKTPYALNGERACADRAAASGIPGRDEEVGALRRAGAG